MKYHCIYACFFLLFCNLHAKDIYLDLEVDLPNKSSVSIEYQDTVHQFSTEDIIHGSTREHVFDVVFYSNVKEGLEIVLSSKDMGKENFCFVENVRDRKIPFELFFTEGHHAVQNGEVIYKGEQLYEPVSKVISMGISLPASHTMDISAGRLSSHFTVILKHIG